MHLVCALSQLLISVLFIIVAPTDTENSTLTLLRLYSYMWNAPHSHGLYTQHATYPPHMHYQCLGVYRNEDCHTNTNLAAA